MQRRAGELANSLQPGERGDIAQAISQVFLAYQQMKLAPSEAKATIALYVSQVSEFPIWAVRQGCEAIIRRPSQWPPSAGEVRTAVEATARAARDERAAITGILTAEITHEPSGDERARIKQGFAKLMGDLGRKTAQPSEQTKAQAEAWLTEQEANPRPAPKLSEAALRACGVNPPTQDEMREVI